MSRPVIEVGEKLHIITRRFFESDIRRHFAGEVIGISDELHEVRGYEFVFNHGNNEFQKRPELRTRIFSLGQEGFIVTKLSREVAIESLLYRFIERRLVVTDGKNFFLDINEFGRLT